MQRLVDEDTTVLWAIKVAARLPLGVFPEAREGVQKTFRYVKCCWFSAASLHPSVCLAPLHWPNAQSIVSSSQLNSSLEPDNATIGWYVVDHPIPVNVSRINGVLKCYITAIVC